MKKRYIMRGVAIALLIISNRAQKNRILDLEDKMRRTHKRQDRQEGHIENVRGRVHRIVKENPPESCNETQLRALRGQGVTRMTYNKGG